ncbi:MAG TPA: FAD:protein FMN transferase [Candidatus Limnocylindrales bacterium]|nr:FAD:protein FMN transferase [Candidatus Limnocylindrales bacterium]
MPEHNAFTKKNAGASGYRKVFNVRYIILVAALILPFVFLFYPRTADPANIFTYHYMLMDTTVEIRFQAVDSRSAEEIKDKVIGEMERLENLFSRTIKDSEISSINNSAGLRPVQVSTEVLHVVEKSLSYAQLSGGAFDPTVAPLVDLWGFLGQEFRVPTAHEIETALTLVDYQLVEVDATAETVYLPLAGMSLELGGIAKGYIIDRALAVLVQAGVQDAFLNAGGDIGLLGSRPDGSPWRIGVRHPRDNREIVAVVPVRDKAVTTSGDYQRFFEENNIRYHHLLDPFTGLPARSLASVTIIAPTALESDALSTAVFILGPEEGMALIERLPNVEAILVTPDLEILISSGLEGVAQLHQ